MRSKLSEATKEDELMKKALLSSRKPKSRKSGAGASSSGKGRAPGRGRDDSRRGDRRETQRLHRSRSRSRSRSRGRQERKQGKKSHYKGKKPAAAAKESKDKSELFSPLSFSSAWADSFFSSKSFELISESGVCTSELANLHCINLGGRLSLCFDNWKIITSSSWVLDVVENGYKIPFKHVPVQSKPPINPPAEGAAYDVLVEEALDLQRKGAVVSVPSVSGQYVSSYFAVTKPRSPGKFRPILNLKYFNRNVKKYKFKMEGLKQVREWIKPGAYMIGIDLKDAFLHIPINPRFRKFLRFQWQGQTLQFKVLPFGLTCSPRVLTKVLKPVMGFLRSKWGILISIYMDDMLLQASSAAAAYLHAQLTVLLLMSLGWEINWKKSSFVPVQEITHLGFILNTSTMEIRCPEDKINRLVVLASSALESGNISVRLLESLLGQMESVRPVTPLAALHYRHVQRVLLQEKRHGRFPARILQLTRKERSDLAWWVSPRGFRANCSTLIREPEPSVEVWSDACLISGGAHNSRGETFRRDWSLEEQLEHINVLETRASREAVLRLCRPGDRVRLHIDNTTACAYIRRQGGTRSTTLCREACNLWKEAVSRGITVLTPHWISTKDNVSADFLSRTSLDNWEFFLHKDLFSMVINHFKVSPTLDVFASAKTAQLPRYMTWFEDPRAVARDALMAKWDPMSYLFPPIPLLPRVLGMIVDQKIEAILICPQWETALWWPTLMELAVKDPLPLPYYKKAVSFVKEGNTLPYLEPLVAVHLSANCLL